MVKAFFRLLFRLKGWSLQVPDVAACSRCVMIAAPHTSNWDLILTLPAFDQMGIPLKFTIKKEWVRFPYDRFFRNIGAVPIDRAPKQGKKKGSKVEEMAKLFDEYEEIAMLVTPEGTRSPNPNWKTGFYHVAVKAQVPIALGYLDYEKKVAGVGDIFMPSGNVEADLARIMAFYKTKAPCHPEKFAVDEELVNKYITH
jgi:1-acyl-sn-glycerol-3-phosphate acyltransferase